MNLNKEVLLKNGKVLFEDSFEVKDIIVKNGKVVKIGNDLNTRGRVIDCTNLLITPGFIDVHVHLREPGFTYKEDISSGSKAAIRGGYTKIYAMPNTNPVMDSISSINLFNQLVNEKAHCDVKTFAALSYGLKGEKLTDIVGLSKLDIAGFSDDGKGLQDDDKFCEAVKLIKNTDKVLSVHSEDMSQLEEGYSIDSTIADKFNCVAINNASEANMVARDLEFVKQQNLSYHVCHVSTHETVDLIKQARSDGFNVSGEVTAHHLVLNSSDIKSDDGNYKMNPPLRSKRDQRALIDALNNDVIDIIASDHAPHSKEEKAKGLCNSAFGIIGLEQTYSVLNTFLIQSNIVDEEKILRAMTYNPARKFNEDLSIKVGSRVNLCIIDANKHRYVDSDTLYSKSNNTPFTDINLQGDIKYTLLDDKIHEWS